MTRDEAIAKLVAHDVAKWGEEEREASCRLRGKLSHGLAINTLAHLDIDHIDEKLAAEAQSVMTTADWHVLRDAG